ncbi:MAG TPA: glycosyltransferase [Acidimicrobiia bacterium]
MTAMPPTVDVVLLSWNRLDDTLAAVDSVLTQEIDSMALWVVDQGSDPKQVAALRRLAADHPEVNLVARSHNVGVPAGRNIGIYSGIAEFVVCLDNDAVFDTPYTLSQAVDLLASDPGLGAVAFRALDHSTRELDLGSWAYPRVHMEASQPVPVTRFVGVGHAVRRAAFIEAGGYDEDLFFCEEELDLSYRMIECGYRILYDPSIVVLHKGSAEERIDWNRGRVYHQARNAVWVQHRHHRRLVKTALVASGWLLRAVHNRQGRQAIRGVRDAIRLLKGEDHTASLSTEARRYIWENDTRLRGSLLKRLRHDVLTALPTRDESPARSS